MNQLQRVNRVDLAIEQLEVALELFLNDRSAVSALTLAGAAEEILGKTLALQGRANVMEEWHDSVDDVWGVPWKEYTRKVNAARNAVKHLSSMEDLRLSFDPFPEAVWMLVRACSNYERLGHEKTDRMWEFEEWYNSKNLHA